MIDLDELNERDALGVASTPMIGRLLRHMMDQHPEAFEESMMAVEEDDKLPKAVLAAMVAAFIDMAEDVDKHVSIVQVGSKGDSAPDARVSDHLPEDLRNKVMEALLGTNWKDVTKH